MWNITYLSIRIGIVCYAIVSLMFLLTVAILFFKVLYYEMIKK
jgi:hypothetical protein